MKYFLITLCTFCFLTGCREDVIPPDNPATNINEPVQQRSFNSFTFAINAENLSFNLVEYPDIHTLYSRLSLSLDDYSSGNAEILILDEDNIQIYSGRLEKNLRGGYYDFVDNLPSVIKISCKGFSGKLKVQLSSL